MSTHKKTTLRIGWASKDLTPDQPALLRGQFHARVSEGVMDPITVTALALESAPKGKPGSQAILVSCDLAAILDTLRDAVRNRLRKRLPDLDPLCVQINATHTHTAPGANRALGTLAGRLPEDIGLPLEDLGVMDPAMYFEFAVERMTQAAAEAWNGRAPGGIGFGLGHAVVGHNRRVSYYTGETRMYGKTDDPEFSHIEGGTDHSVNLLSTWDMKRKLTGMVVNVACPSQVSEQLFQVSADYWHDTRVELRRRFGKRLFILPQCAAAGDQSPHIQVGKAAEERMWRLAGRTQRQDIAIRIADAVSGILPLVKKEIDWNPVFLHRKEVVHLPLRRLTRQDVKDAMSESAAKKARYEELLRDLRAHPELKQKPRWYIAITAAYRGMIWNRNVADRYKAQRTHPTCPFEIHVLRLGQMAIATNPFEYYLDYALQIKARSKAIQTFIVQLAGGGTYLPTLRATLGKSYGAIPASTPIGPEGGRRLAQRTVDVIAKLMEK